MQITRETDYAIRCVLHLAESPGKRMMVDEIARAKQIPKSFLAKILQKLVKAGIVRSFRGVKGGFSLAKSPEGISLLEVIVTIEGTVALNRCVVNRRLCSLSDICSVHPVWMQISEMVRRQLGRCTFAKLLKMHRQ